MVFGFLKNRRGSNVAVKEPSFHGRQNRHHDLTQEILNEGFPNHTISGIDKPASVYNTGRLDPEYITIAPKEDKDPCSERGKSRRGERRKSRIPSVESAIRDTSTTVQGPLEKQREQNLNKAKQEVETEDTGKRRGRKHRKPEHRTPDQIDTTPSNSRKSSRSRSTSRLAYVRSHRSPSRRRIIKIIEPSESRNHRNNNDDNSTSRHSNAAQTHRGRSTSRRRTIYRIPRDDVRTPSPLPELDGRCIDSPATPRSSGPETPIVSRNGHPRLDCQTTGLRTNTSFDGLLQKDLPYARPILYDEQQHSPEDFYNPNFSPIRDYHPEDGLEIQHVGLGDESSNNSMFLETPVRPGLSRLSIDAKNSKRATASNQAEDKQRKASAPPTFNLPKIDEFIEIAPKTRRSLSAQEPIPQLTTRHTQINVPTVEISEPLYELPADVPSPKKNSQPRKPSFPPLDLIGTSTSPRSSSSKTTPGVSKHKPRCSSLDKELPMTPPRELEEPETLSTIRSSGSYERLRPVPPSHRCMHSETTPSSHRRTRSDSITPDSQARSVSAYSYTPTRDSRADRKSFNTVRFLDRSGESHEKLRRVLGI